MTSGIDTIPGTNGFPWLAVQTRSRYENFAASHLRGIGYQVFLPTYKCRRHWSDRVKESDLPLFPGYLFCRSQGHTIGLISTTPGVNRIVSVAGKPCPIPNKEIDALNKIESTNVDLVMCDRPQPCTACSAMRRVCACCVCCAPSA